LFPVIVIACINISLQLVGLAFVNPVTNPIFCRSLQACSCKISQQQLSLEESEREGPVVTDGEDIDATPTQGTGEVALAAPSNPGPSTPVCKGKRKAEADTEDGPVSTAKRNHKPDEVADDKAAYERHWENVS
jgi:hypothetical protein